MLISISKILDNLHISETELREIIPKQQITPINVNDVWLRALAEPIVVTDDVVGQLSTDISQYETWVIYSVSFFNDSRVPDPRASITKAGRDFNWPLPNVDFKATYYGTIADASWFPVVLTDCTITVIDSAFIPGDVIYLNLWATRLSNQTLSEKRLIL